MAARTQRLTGPAASGMLILLGVISCAGLLHGEPAATAVTAVAPGKEWKKEVVVEGRKWWAYQPLTKPVAPTPKDAEWCRGDVDRFVRAILEEKSIKPVGDADPLVLLRRVTFDLTGLPPTPEESKKFLADWLAAKDGQAVLAATVDRLLASPRFGEKWGRHWLDVARYAESSGKDVNVVFPVAWRFRDYVIDSFNRDIPYDRFILEQIAGDLLHAETDAERARDLIATGFLAIGPKSLNDMNPRQFAVDLADEQIDTVSQAILATTMACARCHDHKFDPITQADYTAMAGIFLSTDTRYGTAGGVQGRNKAGLVELPTQANVPIAAYGMTPEEHKLKQERLDALNEQRRDALAARANGGTPKDGLANFDIVRIMTQANQLETELSFVNDDGSPKPLAMGVSDKPLTAPFRRPLQGPGRRFSSGFEIIGDSPLFSRGDVTQPRDTVRRGIPALIPGVATPTIASGASGRLELANWLCDASNPLTSRVIVNRAWGWLFGCGIVASVDNFGTTGNTPSNPELLDYLSQKFIADGWSIKKLVRTIVLSHAYRLSSANDEACLAADSENALIWRHSSRRLEAEEIRDALLAAAGTLNLEPPKASLIGRAGDGPIGGERRMAITEDQVAHADHQFRSVYLAVARNVMPEMLGLFDMPDAATVTGQRSVTNVPSQALFFLNSGFVAKQAGALADNIVKEPQTDSRFDAACWRILNRPARSDEKEAARGLMEHHSGDSSAAWAQLVRSLFASAEFRLLD